MVFNNQLHFLRDLPVEILVLLASFAFFMIEVNRHFPTFAG
jgi:hypothetical protein